MSERKPTHVFFFFLLIERRQSIWIRVRQVHLPSEANDDAGSVGDIYTYRYINPLDESCVHKSVRACARKLSAKETLDVEKRDTLQLLGKNDRETAREKNRESHMQLQMSRHVSRLRSSGRSSIRKPKTSNYFFELRQSQYSPCPLQTKKDDGHTRHTAPDLHTEPHVHPDAHTQTKARPSCIYVYRVVRSRDRKPTAAVTCINTYMDAPIDGQTRHA